jgi:hypothetical protein
MLRAVVNVKHGRWRDSWWTTNTPTTGPTGTSTTWIGVRLTFTVAGRVQGIRFYDAWGGQGSTLVVMMDWATTRMYRMAGFYHQLALHSAQWNNVWIHPNFRPTVNTDYAILALFVGGGFYRNNAALTSPVTRTGIRFVSSFQVNSLDLGSATFTENTNANAVDVLYLPD